MSVLGWPYHQNVLRADVGYLQLASTFLGMVPLFDLSLRERISPKGKFLFRNYNRDHELTASSPAKPVALQQAVARDRVGLTNKSAIQPLDEDSPGSDQNDGVILVDAQQQHIMPANGLQPAHPVLSIRTNNLTPTPMFTSAFTTTPLSTYPPLTPQNQPTPGGMSLVVGGTPRHSVDEMSATPFSSYHGSQNGTQSQQGKLKRKLDRSLDYQEEGGDGPGIARQQSQKRVAPNARKQSSTSTVNEI
jgi:hypothetical protein